MERRDFLMQTGGLLALLAGGQTALAADAKSDKGKADNTKESKRKKPAKPVTHAPFVPGSWTLVILPDIQYYSEHFPGVLCLQTRWIVENKTKHNIVYVLQNGDITNRSSKREWANASRGFEVLDGVVPYALVPGNHDHPSGGSAVNRTTLINDYFPPSRFEKWTGFGGVMEKGRIENNYHLFEAGGKKWLLLGLEWGPRDVALDWAGSILDRFADRKALVFTHSYLAKDGTRYDWAVKGREQGANPHRYKTPGSVHDGQEMWQKLIRKHANVFMVMNGHDCQTGSGLQVSRGDRGNVVNEMVVDYQNEDVGGGGWLRLLEFLPDGKTIQAKTYSPLYDRYWNDVDNQFTMTIE